MVRGKRRRSDRGSSARAVGLQSQQPIERVRRKSTRRARSLVFEPLEDRRLLAGDLDVKFAFTDLGGQPLTSLQVGDPFLVKAYVRDARSSPTGVFQAYFDVNFDPSLVTLPADKTLDPGEYRAFSSGTVLDSGLIDEVGGLDFDQVAPDPRGRDCLLFQSNQPWTAAAPGTLTFTATAADSPLHWVEFFDDHLIVPAGEINFQNSIEILSGGIRVTPTSGLTTTEAGGTASFEVVLTKLPTASVTIGLASSDLTEGTVSPASLTFTTANWNVAQHVTVTGVNDDVIDGPVGYTIVTAPAVSTDANYSGKNPDDVSVTNTDDDATTVSIVATDASGSEPGTDDGLFTVTLAGGKLAPPAGIVVNYTIAGNATPGADYTAFSGSATIPAGASSATIVVDVLSDEVVEPIETVTLTLTGANRASVTVGTPNSASVNITDDDTATVSIARVADGAEATTPAGGKFRVTQTKASSTATAVAYTVNGTATPGAGNDYAALSGTVTIPAGATTADIDVQVFNDNIVEGTETVIVALTGISSGNADISLATANQTAAVSITDDDTATVSIARVNDGAETAAPTNGKFRVTQMKASSADTVLSYTVGGTATAGAGSDYTPLSGSVTIPAGTTTADIDVSVLNDDVVEATETVIVTLGGITSSSPGVTVNESNKTATVSITDDDTATVSIGKVNDGAEAATPTAGKFRVTQTKVSSTDTVLSYTVSGTATPGAGNDYSPLSGTVTIPAGVTTADIDVPVLDDDLVESNETVIVTLSGITSGDPQIAIDNGNKTATVWIADDDTALVSIAKVNDGAEAATPTNGRFRVTQTKASATATVLSYTVGGTATPGAGNDYAALSGTVTIAAGTTTADINVSVFNDNVVEGPETVIVTLSAVTGGDPDITIDAAKASDTVTIADDDTATVSLIKVNDGAEAATPTNGKFRVTQTKVSAAATVLSYTVTGTATPGAGNDYTPLSGSVTIPAGATTADIDVLVLNDNVVEATETVMVTLSGVPSSSPGVSLNTANQTTTLSISDDDTATVSIDKVNDGAEAAAPVAGKFRLTQTKPSSTDTVLNYSIGGTATPGAGNDYAALSGTVAIPAGATTADIDVLVLDDSLVEGAETVIVTLTEITSGDPQVTIDNANQTDTVSIADDDIALVSIARVTDGAEAAVPVAGKFRVTQTKASATNTVVGYTIHGTATPGAGNDYLPLSGSVTILAGATTADIDVPVLNDDLVEGAETVIVTLGSVTSSAPGISVDNAAPTATVSIADDDTATVSIAKDSEGAEAATPTSGKFRLTQTKASATDTVIGYTVNGTATPGAGNDYVSLSGTVTIPAGAITADIDVTVLNDDVVEDTETVIVTLGSITSSSPGVSLDGGNQTAIVAITDDDTATVSVAAISDGAESPTPTDGKFRVTQTKASSTDTVISYALSGTATPGPGNDYVPLAGSVTVPAGQTTADIDVVVRDDNLVEIAETVVVTLDSITSGDPQIALGTANQTATVMISSDDAATISISGTAPLDEGDSGTRTLQFVVTLSAPVDVPVSVSYQTQDETAQDEQADGDYQSASGILEFSPGGDLTQTIAVDVYGDAVVEPDETLLVVLSNVIAGTPARDVTLDLAQAVGTIVDDDAARLTIEVNQHAEEDASHGVFTITTNKQLSQPVTVFLAVSGTAAPDTDYVALGASVTFPANADTLSIPVTVLSDDIIEGDETVIVQILNTSDPAARPGEPEAATLTIADNDTATVSITASDPAGSEPSADDAQLTVALDHGLAPPGGLEVSFSVNGTATSGSDYVALGGSVTIPAGQSSATIPVDVLDDSVVELTETVIVTLTGTNNLGATIDPANHTATVSIADEDTATVSIEKVHDGVETATPGHGKFRVTLTKFSATDTVLSYTVTGTALPGAGNDYVTLSGTVTIMAGDATADIEVAVLDDDVVEDTETVMITLEAITSGDEDISIDSQNATAQIGISDEDAATLSIARIEDGAEGAVTTSGRFRVTQTKPSSTDTVLSYTVAGSASPGVGNDYTLLSGTVTIAAGSLTADIEVVVLDDSLVEDNETAVVTLAGITSGDPQIAIGETSRTATLIIADDDKATVSIAKVDDGVEDHVPTNGKFRVTQTLPSATDTVVSYMVSGTATPDDDYTPLSGSVTIPARATTVDLDIVVLNDDWVEGGETVIVTLNAVTSGDPDVDIDDVDNSATLLISDDDTAIVSVEKVADGAEAATPAHGTFRVVQTRASAADTVLSYTVSGTATPGDGNDYTPLSGTVTIAAGSLTADIDVAVLDDDLVEGTETVIVTLTGITSVLPGVAIDITSPYAYLDILDDDEAAVSIARINDGAEGAVPTNGRFLVTQTKPSDTDTVLTYLVTGTATPGAGEDYTPLVGTLTIAAGQTSAEIVLPVLNDLLVEETETVIVTLSAIASGDPDVSIDPTNKTATVSILDEIASVSIEASDATAGEPGADEGQFLVTLTGGRQAPPGGIQVNYTVSGSATPGADYAALSGVATIPSGQSSVSIPVVVLDDNVVELPETVVVTLNGVDHPNIAIETAANQAIVTIDDDDPTTVSIVDSDPSGSEPGTDDGEFTVTLNGGKIAPAGGVTVSYTVSGTATGEADYTALTGTVTIPAGQSSITIPIDVLDDNIVERPETVILTLSGTNHPAVIVQAAADTATVTIHDGTGEDADATTVSIAASDATGSEPGEDDGGFTVSLAGDKIAPDEGITVTYEVSGTATPGSDYTALTGMVTIPAGQSSATILVEVLNDDIVELPETVIITLTGTDHPGVTIAATENSAIVTISDDIEPGSDATTVSITATDPVGSEPGADNGLFTVTLAGGKLAPTGGITVNYTVSGSATAGSDYTSLTGTVTIPAGASSATILVDVLDDDIVEAAETVIVTLTSTDHAAVTVNSANNTATATINDDDPTTVSIAASDATASEPGTDDGAFTVTLAGGKIAPTGGIAVTYTVAGTATAGADYTTLTGTVTIPAGQSSATILGDVLDDNVVEVPETVIVTLTGTNHSGATIHATNNTATVTIDSSDDNTTVSISSPDATGREPGTDGAQLTVTLANSKVAPTGGIVVNYNTSGTATAGSDYTALPGTVTIPAGASSATIAVSVLDDNVVESAETVIVTLTGTNHAGATIAAINNSATVTIEDNDPTTVSISASDANAGEPGDNGQFTVTLDNGKVAPTGGIVVNYTTAGTATAGSDYTSLPGTVTILAGQPSATIPVNVIDDTTADEPAETVVVTLTSANHASVSISTSSPSATVTIAADDLRNASISGVVWIDANNDRQQQKNTSGSPLEPGIPGVIVRLTGTARDGSTLTLQAMTDDDGAYRFYDLPAGTYDVREEHPAAWIDGQEMLASSTANDTYSNIVLTPGQHAVDYSFGERTLQPQFVSKRQFLASTPATDVYLRELNALAKQRAGDAAGAQAIRDASIPSDVSAGSTAAAAASAQVTAPESHAADTAGEGEAAQTNAEAADTSAKAPPAEGEGTPTPAVSSGSNVAVAFRTDSRPAATPPASEALDVRRSIPSAASTKPAAESAAFQTGEQSACEEIIDFLGLQGSSHSQNAQQDNRAAAADRGASSTLKGSQPAAQLCHASVSAETPARKTGDDPETAARVDLIFAEDAWLDAL